jgi:hypothetical protein
MDSRKLRLQFSFQVWPISFQTAALPTSGIHTDEDFIRRIQNRHRIVVTRSVVLTIAVGLLSAMYVYLLFFAKHLDEPGTRPKGGFSSLAGVISLFKSPRVVLVGWIHFLAFDLMVGLYIATDAARVGIVHWWLLPVLFLTLMFGPMGLLLYLVIRAAISPGAWLFALN